jgi:hypothetical protein
MPAWTPNWNDVRFDHHAAMHFAHTCRRAASMLDATMDTRVELAGSTAVEWAGAHRDSFDRNLIYERQLANAVVTDLVQSARSAEAASSAAMAAQRQREADRQRWQEEVWREELHRREADQRAAEQRAAEQRAADERAASELAASDGQR